jgi:acyl carrier protein
VPLRLREPETVDMSTTTFTKEDIQEKVIAALNEMTQDWDLELADGIGAKTQIMKELAFESIDVVQFVVVLEQAFERKGLPFEKLFMVDGDYVDDLQVCQVVDFLHEQLNA